MKIIALDESNPQSYGYYTALDNLFYLLAEKLPKFFLEPVRTYHILYDANEGPKYRLKIGKHTYSVTADGELLTTNNQPLINPDFTPYD